MNSKFLSLVRISFVIVLMLSSIAAAPMSQQTKNSQASTVDLLNDLGGSPCFEGSAFTCVIIDVPLDHFNASLGTIPVTFAVLPASGERKGMFVTATGGPGYSGVASADAYLPGFDASITEIFDIVFFDQRGISSSGDQTCPYAANAYYQRDARGKTQAQETALKQSAKSFSNECVAEVSNPDILPYLGTRQAVEDLEVFRQLVGDEKFWLYGESYGTQYAQTYAAFHSEHLAGLMLDGTVDLTLDGITYYAGQAQAFNDTLVLTMADCKADPACHKDMSGKPIKAYDALVTTLKNGPIRFKFPLPEGGFANRQFTLTNLDFVTASQMYSEGDRMLFTRALAAYESKSDMVPLARLLYLDMGVDPQTLEVIPDPYYSDAVYYAVECQDYAYPGNTPNKKAEKYLKAADPYEASVPRLASLVYGDLPCAYWPNPSSEFTRPAYLTLEDVPTLVLGSTADPATPVSNGINVYQNLANAYLITQDNGPHVIYGRGNECPDALVTDFLVNDIVPAEKETTCEGYVMDTYVPLAPRFAVTFRNPYRALSSVETEIYYLPEFYYWDGYTPTSVGCTYGGVISFASNEDGTIFDFSLDKCAFTTNFIMTGSGTYDTNVDEFILAVQTQGRWKCDLEYNRLGEDVDVSGKCDGKRVKENHSDEEHNMHNAPNHKEPKEDGK